MRNRKFTVLIISICVVALGILGYKEYTKHKNYVDYDESAFTSLETVLRVDFNKVDKITTATGNSGKATVITDKDKIQEYIKIFKQMNVKKDMDYDESQPELGCILSATLFSKGKRIVGFTYGHDTVDVYIENTEFPKRYISDINIDDDKVEEIINKFNII